MSFVLLAVVLIRQIQLVCGTHVALLYARSNAALNQLDFYRSFEEIQKHFKRHLI